MSDRATPRTDWVNSASAANLEDRYDRMHDLSEELERELAETREWPAMLSGWGGTPEIVHEFIKGQQERIHAAQDVEKELAEAQSENLEQARLLGMSAEREADLRGELEREKRRAQKNKVLARYAGIKHFAAIKQCDRLVRERDELRERMENLHSVVTSEWESKDSFVERVSAILFPPRSAPEHAPIRNEA